MSRIIPIKQKRSPGPCPVCERPIEPGFCVACTRCFALFPGSDRVSIRKRYCSGRDIKETMVKMVRITRERYPVTRPASIRDKSPLGPSLLVGMDLASGPDSSHVARIIIE